MGGLGNGRQPCTRPHTPANELQRVARRRKSDADYGRDGHKYLTPDQVGALIKAARKNRHGPRVIP